MTDLPTRLARKWSESCERHRHQVEHWCCDGCIAAAIREALEEAERIAGDEQRLWEDSIDTRPLLERQGAVAERQGAVAASFTIAAEIAALREGE